LLVQGISVPAAGSVGERETRPKHIASTAAVGGTSLLLRILALKNEECKAGVSKVLPVSQGLLGMLKSLWVRCGLIRITWRVV
jgi:hypothetical protein